MAPEVREGRSCSFSSDMYSFGGLLFFAMFQNYCASFGDMPLPSTMGNIDIPHHDDVELRRILQSLLARYAEQRLSASLAMSHPYFSATGSKAREEVFDKLRQLQIMQEDMVSARV
jgi:serine/threonine protein kinase